MDIATITASIAGICMAVCQVPQALKIYKAGTAEGLSILMQIILTTGILFWFITGILMHSVPMWASNGFCLIFCLYVLGMCIRDRIMAKK